MSSNSGFVYVLHFDDSLSHANHYVGCTRDLNKRLLSHAMGAGSRITRALYERNIGFRLATLFQCSVNAMFRIERSLKDAHNSDRYCGICSGTKTIAPRGSMPYDFSFLPYKSSNDFKKEGRVLLPPSYEIRPVETSDDSTVLQIKKLMRDNGDMLGFIPIGGQKGLGQLVVNGFLIVLVLPGGIVGGYLAFSRNQAKTRIRIHQIVVEDTLRLFGFGRELLSYVALNYPNDVLTCNVRADLAANGFWINQRFELIGTKVHVTSDSLINYYLRHPSTYAKDSQNADLQRIELLNNDGEREGGGAIIV